MKHKNRKDGWRDQEACKWLQRQFEENEPPVVMKQVIDVLKNETAATGLFRAIAGLSLIADGKGDRKGHNACADSLIVLANVRHNIEAISEDFEKEMKKRGSSYL